MDSHNAKNQPSEAKFFTQQPSLAAPNLKTRDLRPTGAATVEGVTSGAPGTWRQTCTAQWRTPGQPAGRPGPEVLALHTARRARWCGIQTRRAGLQRPAIQTPGTAARRAGDVGIAVLWPLMSSPTQSSRAAQRPGARGTCRRVQGPWQKPRRALLPAPAAGPLVGVGSPPENTTPSSKPWRLRRRPAPAASPSRRAWWRRAVRGCGNSCSARAALAIQHGRQPTGEVDGGQRRDAANAQRVGRGRAGVSGHSRAR